MDVKSAVLSMTLAPSVHREITNFKMVRGYRMHRSLRAVLVMVAVGWGWMVRALPDTSEVAGWRESHLGRAFVAHFISNDLCYLNADWLLSCVNALNKAGELLLPPLRVEAVENGELTVLREERPKAAATGFDNWFKIFERRTEDARTTRDAVRAYFKHVRGLPLASRLNFEAQLESMTRTLPPEIPVQMLWGYAINGHLATFDAHAYLKPASVIEAAQLHSQKSFVGIGLNLDLLSSGVYVHQVFTDSPAARAGVQADDRVLAIASDAENFQEVQGLSLENLYALISGKPDTHLVMRIERDGNELTVPIERGPVQIPNVEGELIGSANDVGYLDIRGFASLDTCWAARRKLENLKAAGAKRWILDLRGNPGGSTRMAICVAGLFVGQRRILGTRGIDLSVPSLVGLLPQNSYRPAGDTGWEFGSTKQVFNEPLVVLIDALSASASEIVAGAVQFYRENAWIVGERSSGKGSVQIFDTPAESPDLRIAHTVGIYFLPGGLSTQISGVTPDFEASLRRDADPVDRYYPRERDLFPNALSGDPLQATHPSSNRTGDTHLNECLANPIAPLQRPVAGRSRTDNQIASALAVLNCFQKQ